MERAASTVGGGRRNATLRAVGEEPRATLADLAEELGADAAIWLGATRGGALGARRGAPRSAPALEPALPRGACDALRAGEVRWIRGGELARLPLARARGLAWIALAREAGGGLLYLEGRAEAGRAAERLARAARRVAERARAESDAREPSPASAALAHDLRNQLALAALECRRVAALESSAERALEPVESALGAARELCAALLGAGFALARRVQLRPFLERELAVAQRVARGPGGVRVVLRCASALEVELDPAALARCTQNLVSNAIEASAQGERVEVEASALPSGQLELVVRDRGAGMDACELARSMRAGTSGRGGAGYGTASALACVERMGATLEIESERGCGTRVRLAIPGACALRPAALVVVDPDPHAGSSDDESPRGPLPAEAVVVRDLAGLELLAARRMIARVVARRSLPANERARLAALCRRVGLEYEETSVATARRSAMGETATPSSTPTAAAAR